MNDIPHEEKLNELPFMDKNLEIEKRIEDLLARLMIKEKFLLISGHKFVTTRPIDRLGMKSFKMTDGPHGIGAIASNNQNGTYFPVAICRCSTWNPGLSEKFGKALAEEVRAIGFHMLLAPGVNIHRSPMCGRNFEYQTEDPYLNSKMVVSAIKGVQSQKIAACIKHYVANNQETNRFTVNANISERALHEIYFPAFKAAVQEADVLSVMSAYNKVNGTYCSENKYLLREILMDDWGFRGFVVSDWGATQKVKSPASCINAGLSLEMPAPIKYRKRKLTNAFEEGKFKEETLDELIRRLLRVMFFVGLFEPEDSLPKGSINTPEHKAVARKIAEEGIVLLKNDGILPLDILELKKIAVIGPSANKKTFLGGGSSAVNAFHEVKPLTALQNKCKNKIEIVESPSEADVVILFAGLDHALGNDSEGADRKQFELPSEQIELINETSKVNPKIIIVLISGSPVAMDWLNKVQAVIEAWYPGCEGGNAIADVLFGDVNPSGKLPITFPKKIEDSPAHKSPKTFPGNGDVYYDEGVLVGYRYFDTKKIEPLFSFGHGLSYTTFKYENLKLEKKKMTKNDEIKVSCDVLNVGEREGAEIIQLYIQDVEASVERSVKELKGFKKINFKPGEKATVNLKIGKAALSFYDEKEHCWRAEKGIFKILIGSSSRDIRLEDEIEFIG